jgi:hypothetical protein
MNRKFEIINELALYSFVTYDDLVLPQVKPVIGLKNKLKEWNNIVNEVYNIVIRKTGASVILSNMPTTYENSSELITIENITDTLYNFIEYEDLYNIIRLNDTSYLLFLNSEDAISVVVDKFNGNIIEGKKIKVKIIKPVTPKSYIYIDTQPISNPYLQLNSKSSYCRRWLILYTMLFMCAYIIPLIQIYHIHGKIDSYSS